MFLKAALDGFDVEATRLGQRVETGLRFLLRCDEPLNEIRQNSHLRGEEGVVLIAFREIDEHDAYEVSLNHRLPKLGRNLLGSRLVPKGRRNNLRLLEGIVCHPFGRELAEPSPSGTRLALCIEAIQKLAYRLVLPF
jgi:hypothetical protein